MFGCFYLVLYLSNVENTIKNLRSGNQWLMWKLHNNRNTRRLSLRFPIHKREDWERDMVPVLSKVIQGHFDQWSQEYTGQRSQRGWFDFHTMF